jgi:hypothetical protein
VKLGVKDLGDLKAHLKVSNWREIIQEFVDEYLSLRKVDSLRNRASMVAKQRYDAAQRSADSAPASRSVPVSGSAPASGSAAASGSVSVLGTQKSDESRNLKSKAQIAKGKLKAEQEKERDYVFEKACLLLLHALIYWDFHTAIRSGDTGRVERCLDMFAVMFQGTSLCNYAYLTLDMSALCAKVWIGEMRELWL